MKKIMYLRALVLYIKYYRDQIMEDKMDGTCYRYIEDEKHM
jgi:hypothetical protein